jgi:hypothetical protein
MAFDDREERKIYDAKAKERRKAVVAAVGVAVSLTAMFLEREKLFIVLYALIFVGVIVAIVPQIARMTRFLLAKKYQKPEDAFSTTNSAERRRKAGS